MAAVTDLWGEIATNEAVRTPLSILKEQATLLSQKTQNLLRGQVSTSAQGSSVRHAFRIVVPALDDYTYELFAVGHHSAYLYPVNTVDYKELRNEEEFTEWLGQMLTSPETKRIISNLLAQARS